MSWLTVLLVLALSVLSVQCWVHRDVMVAMVKKFEELESERSKEGFRGTDRRSSAPFISGDGFRIKSAHVCEDSNRCRIHPEAITNGSCVFVKTDLFDFFVKEVVPRIPGPYRIITHNGDLSAPDGQDDAPRIGMPQYVTSNLLAKEYASGRLISHHGQNLWWKNNSFSPRPVWSHCLPIGLENRHWNIGKNLRAYIDAIKTYVLDKPDPTPEQLEAKPLLLIAFYPKSRVPDRQKVLSIIGASPPKGQPKPTNPWYNETDLDHAQWLEGVTLHKFVLAPFGHGLDTHRISEILLMGGIPVMRRSTISSCYDDTDNTIESRPGHTVTRGSLPIVLLDSWQDLTAERLKVEWVRIQQTPASKWDTNRVFIDHWLERIGCPDSP